MFGAYTWGDFTEFVILLTLGYYVVIIYCFYRKDFHQFLLPFLSQPQTVPASENSNPLNMVHEMVSELSRIIREGSNNNTHTPELLFALQSTCKEFIVLESSEYKQKINLYIAEELEIHGIHNVSMEEIENLWKS